MSQPEEVTASTGRTVSERADTEQPPTGSDVVRRSRLKLAERLISLGLDERVKGYTAVSAISEVLKILQQGVVDKEQRDQLNAIKETLDQLEGGTPNVIDV